MFQYITAPISTVSSNVEQMWGESRPLHGTVGILLIMCVFTSVWKNRWWLPVCHFVCNFLAFLYCGHHKYLQQ